MLFLSPLSPVPAAEPSCFPPFPLPPIFCSPFSFPSPFLASEVARTRPTLMREETGDGTRHSLWAFTLSLFPSSAVAADRPTAGADRRREKIATRLHLASFPLLLFLFQPLFPRRRKSKRIRARFTPGCSTFFGPFPLPFPRAMFFSLPSPLPWPTLSAAEEKKGVERTHQRAAWFSFHPLLQISLFPFFSLPSGPWRAMPK